MTARRFSKNIYLHKENHLLDPKLFAISKFSSLAEEANIKKFMAFEKTNETLKEWNAVLPIYISFRSLARDTNDSGLLVISYGTLIKVRSIKLLRSELNCPR